MNIIDVLFDQTPVRRIVMRLDFTFHRVPHLPKPLMEFLVEILPALFAAMGILHGVMGALIIITGAKFLSVQLDFIPPVNPFYLIITGMLAMSNGIFMLLAYSDVRAKTVTGWRSLVMVNAITVLQSIINVMFSPSSALLTILYILITMYLTFEFKPFLRSVSGN